MWRFFEDPSKSTETEKDKLQMEHLSRSRPRKQYGSKMAVEESSHFGIEPLAALQRVELAARSRRFAGKLGSKYQGARRGHSRGEGRGRVNVKHMPSLPNRFSLKLSFGGDGNSVWLFLHLNA